MVEFVGAGVDALNGGLQAAFVVAAQQDAEFVAAVAGDECVRTEGALQKAGGVLERRVADVVAEAVVDGFEAVDVEQDRGKTAVCAVPHSLREADVELPAVVEAGEVVDVHAAALD